MSGSSYYYVFITSLDGREYYTRAGLSDVMVDQIGLVECGKNVFRSFGNEIGGLPFSEWDWDSVRVVLDTES